MTGLCLLVVVVALVLAWRFTPWVKRPQGPILRDQTVEVDGLTRKFRLVIPASPPANSPAPLLIALHGAGGSAEGMARSTRLDRLAAAKGFYLAYPEGRHASWPPFIAPENPGYIEPDLLFFDALCEELSGRFNIDERRIYVTGMSQGAAFTNLLVARRSDKIAAAAPHSGWLPNPLPDQGIAAARKCPMLLIGGTEDRQVPPEFVRKSAECFAREGHPVILHLVTGLGHRWDSQHNINETIWGFLSSFQLP